MQSAQILEQGNQSGISSCPTLGTTPTSYVNDFVSLAAFYSGLFIKVERCVPCVARQGLRQLTRSELRSSTSL